MAVLVTAIHVLPRGKDVDTRDKPAHDGVFPIERHMLYSWIVRSRSHAKCMVCGQRVASREWIFSAEWLLLGTCVRSRRRKQFIEVISAQPIIMAERHRIGSAG